MEEKAVLGWLTVIELMTQNSQQHEAEHDVAAAGVPEHAPRGRSNDLCVGASLVTHAKNERDAPRAIAEISEDGIARLSVAASGGKATWVVATAPPPATGTNSIVAPIESYGASAKDALENANVASQAAKRPSGQAACDATEIHKFLVTVDLLQFIMGREFS